MVPPSRIESPDVAASRFSIAGRLAGVTLLALLAHSALVLAGSRTPLAPWLVQLLSLGIVAPGAAWAVARVTRPLRRTLVALSDGIRAFHDRDFSMRLAVRRGDELGRLTEMYNRVGETLRDERAQIRQRELLLQTALDRSPIAILLVGLHDRIAFANLEARRLFLGGERMLGLRYAELVDHCPAEMRHVMRDGGDGLFTLTVDDEVETYHLTQRGFRLNRAPHRLVLLRRMTGELARRESEIWKQVIRVISHELNNSLAPISSLAHSGLLVARSGERLERLEPIHDAMRERIEHLTGFLEGYARFARLPEPRPRWVEWSAWLAGPRRLYRFELEHEPPVSPGWFDPAQVEQVLINLLKNAAEASDCETRVEVGIDCLVDGSSRLRVLDRGRGMTEEVMRRALLPFYSTKPSGGGVGLPLCREIVDAHGGTLRIQNRSGGGTVVTVQLPGRP